MVRPISMSGYNKGVMSPCVLLIGGLDPSGGAGLAADQRACLAAGTWPLPVASVITVQSTAGLDSVHPLEASLVVDQARRVLRDQNVKALKLGALGSRKIIDAVADLIAGLQEPIPVVLDPVMGATRGANGLLPSDALQALRRLARSCSVVTPNRKEASVLSGIHVDDSRSAGAAATQLQRSGPRAVLLKGGHLSGPRAIDYLALGTGVKELSSPRLDVPEFHGSGCTMASLIAAHLATHDAASPTGQQIMQAVRYAKQRMFDALQRLRVVGEGLRVLSL